jgi:hypothetical protein
MLADPAQLDRLKNELGITPAQEEAWKEYANAVEDAADKMTAMHESMGPGAVRDWSPADRFAFMTSTREELHTRFQTVQAGCKRAPRHARRGAEGHGAGSDSLGLPLAPA